MTKEVLLAIKGLQFDSTMDETQVEIITAGDYYKKNNKHYIFYDEVTEGFQGNTKNILKFNDNSLDLMKKGIVNVHMIFEENKKNITSYNTPFGNIFIGIDAKKINITEVEERILVNVDYALEVNYEHVADCKISMDIQAKDNADFFRA